MSGLAHKKDTLAINADKMIRILRGGNIGEEQFYFKGDDVFISSELVNPVLYLRRNFCFPVVEKRIILLYWANMEDWKNRISKEMELIRPLFIY